MPDEPDLTGAYVPMPQAPAERFAPGTLLAGRFRIVAALGKGGMGEVYRADDLTLAQPVALKFLPQHLSADSDRLSRFRKEVAAARKVSHPHVCRVYDIVEHDGQSFLTMEFVDGEDLSSVLKRLGRVPEEKGIEIAVQLCSALAAVHDQGLLHRDLKPANVMLDGRGKVRLTDFGLAAAAEDLSLTEVRSGTPLYQAPEQIAGKEVTVRSDLYSLGLVLYELFTGKRAFTDAKRDTPPSKPTSHVSALNPAIERVILRCLEADPANRPRSALEMLSALPGGDPLAAAVAAGETPSPQLVADAGEVGLIKPWVGAVLLAVVAIELVAVAWLYDLAIFRRAPMPTHPEALAHQARDILRDLGSDDATGDTAAGFQTDVLAETYAYRKDARFMRGEPAWLGGPAPVHYFHRRGAGALTPHFTGQANGLFVSDDNPPPITPGMAGVTLDPAGRLLGFYVVPGSVPGPNSAGSVDWRPWIVRAGLDPDRFEIDPTRSAGSPPVFCSRVDVWKEKDPAAGTGCRIETGTARGRPVYFRVTGPWHVREEWGAEQGTYWEIASRFYGAINFIILTLMLVLGVSNMLRGRADLRTAVGMGGFVLAVVLMARVFAGGHSAAPAAFAAPAIGWAIWVGLLAGIGYLGIEPTARRLWPWRLTGWVRLFSGRVRDPLVGRDALAGLTGGFLVVIAYTGLGAVVAELGVSSGFEPSFVPNGFAGAPTFGVNASSAVRLIGTVSEFMTRSVYSLAVALALFLVFRRERVALAAFLFLYAGLGLLQNWGDSAAGNLLQSANTVVQFGVLVFMIARFGLLALAFLAGTNAVLSLSPITATTSAWYFGTGAISAVAILGLAGFCAYNAIGGRRMLRRVFFGDE